MGTRRAATLLPVQNTAIARIDLGALRDNLMVARKLCPRSRIMAMVKADAYGHGLVPAAKALCAADAFAVARLQEALTLRDAGVSQRILVLGTLLDPADLAACSTQNIDVTAHDALCVAAIASAARHGSLRVWLKLDSGMHRLGLDPASFIAADRQLADTPGVREVLHMTHFSSADDAASAATDRQIECFFACHQHNPRAGASLANSAALISRPNTHADWVRPGILLYGGQPSRTHDIAVRPAMTLVTRVLALRHLEAGEAVGYHRRWISPRSSRIATLGIGYGDGYPRHAANGTPICINGRRVPLVGRVSMDSLTVDVTDCERIAVGDEAVLWGPELPAAQVAEHADTIDYALFTALSQRVTREYR